jgi:hypothetical membrane protein
VIWLAGAAVYLVSEAIASASLPGYSYVADYISDLGAVAVINVGFMVHDSLFLLGAVVISRGCPTLGWVGWGFVLAAAANAIGNVLVGIFRSGAAVGHVHWHAVGAGMAIMAGTLRRSSPGSALAASAHGAIGARVASSALWGSHVFSRWSSTARTVLALFPSASRSAARSTRSSFGRS